MSNLFAALTATGGAMTATFNTARTVLALVESEKHAPTKEKTMSSQTFEGVDGTRLLHIKNLGKHVAMSIEVPGQVHMGITFDPASIPALALAELEAAGLTVAKGDVKQDSFEDFMIDASLHLKAALRLQERITAEAKEQAELESEALELYNARISFLGGEALTSFEKLNQDNKDMWLAVARRARELRAEK